MILPDWRMKAMLHSDINALDVTPLDIKEQIQPASIDLRIGQNFKVLRPPTTKQRIVSWFTRIIPELRHRRPVFDPLDASDEYDEIHVGGKQAFILPPQTFALAHTIERVTIPNNIVGVVHGRSSWARVGVDPHLGGYIDPGFSGQITLELSNETNRPIVIHPGQRFCQIAFHKMTSSADNPYNGKYQNDTGVHGTRLNQDTQ